MHSWTGLFILGSVLFSVERWIRAGGYFVLFGLLLACGMGLPLPEDIPLTIAGFLVAKGHMNLLVAAVVGWCGIIGGDLILYQLGKRYGLNITMVPFVGKHVTQERIRQAEVLFERYGIWVVAIGRMFAGIRGAMVIAAGATRYSRVKFVLADGVAALVSGGVFVALGYWVGEHLGTLEQLEKFRQEKIAGVEHWVLAGIGAVVVGLIAYVWFRHKTHERPSEALMEKAVEHVEHEHQRQPQTK